MNSELTKKIEKGNKRMAIVTTIEALILFIPLLFLIGNKYWVIFVITYFILLIIAIRFAPSICNRIWKND